MKPSTKSDLFSYNEKEVTLPNGFYDEKDEKLYKKVIVREMTGEEEDILLNEKEADSGMTLNRILENVCTLKDKPKLNFIQSLLMVDQLFLIVQARILTHGNNLRFEVTHEKASGGCGQQTGVNLELDSLEFNSSPKPKELIESIELPKSKCTVTFKKNQGKDQSVLSKLLRSKSSDKFTQLLQYRTLKLEKDGKEIPKDLLKKLPGSDRKLLREYMNKSEGKAETSIEVDCSNCGSPVKATLPIDEGFFCLTEHED